MATPLNNQPKLTKQFDNILNDLGLPQKDVDSTINTPMRRVLADWTDDLIVQMQDKLQSKGRVASGQLSQSIQPLPVVVKDGVITVAIEMESYWKFINEGVNGVQNNWGSDYNFAQFAKTQSQGKTFKQSIKEWFAFKGINSLSYTNKDGEQVQRPLVDDKDYDAAAFMFMQSIKKKGIEPSYFVDDVLTDDAITDLENSIYKLWQ